MSMRDSRNRSAHRSTVRDGAGATSIARSKSAAATKKATNPRGPVEVWFGSATGFTPESIDFSPGFRRFCGALEDVPGCGDVKPVDGFSRDASRKDGRMARCRECDNAASKARYMANRETLLARARARREPPASATCEECGDTFKPSQNGQRFCGTRRCIDSRLSTAPSRRLPPRNRPASAADARGRHPRSSLRRPAPDPRSFPREKPPSRILELRGVLTAGSETEWHVGHSTPPPRVSWCAPSGPGTNGGQDADLRAANRDGRRPRAVPCWNPNERGRPVTGYTAATTRSRS